MFFALDKTQQHKRTPTHTRDPPSRPKSAGLGFQKQHPKQPSPASFGVASPRALGLAPCWPTLAINPQPPEKRGLKGWC